MPKRVNVYFDWQNCYHSAVDTFPRGCSGTIDPLKTATKLAARALPGADPDRKLETVKIFRGLPNARKDRRTNAAVQKQISRWSKPPYASRVEVHTRPLAYRTERVVDATGVEIWQEFGREKGVDVELAISLVRDTILTKPAACDVAIVFSEDTDFYPAYEMILDAAGKDVLEVARWHDPAGYAPDPPLIRGVRIRQHLLDQKFFHSVEDRTAY